MGINAVPDADYITPATLAPSLAELDELRGLLPGLVARRQWMAWRGVPKLDKEGQPTGKVGKPPVNPHTGGPGKHNDPATWGSLEEALAVGADGVGFTLSESDPFCIVDIDGAIDEDGALTELAGRVLDAFAGCYVELSPSGRGLHIIIEGKLPGGGRNSQKLGLEVYDRLRFVTVTGEYFGERSTVKPMQGALDWLLAEFWPEAPAAPKTAPAPPASLIGDDAVLVERILSSKQGGKFQKLWLGEWAGDYESQSDADLALCGMLQFYARGDAARVDRLFRSSELMRPKWDEQHGAQTYGAMTVEKALAGSTGHYSGRKAAGARSAKVVNTREEAGEAEGAAPAKLERVIDRDNEAANAERLIEHHRHELRYVRGLGWLRFDGRRWALDEEGARTLAAGVARYVEEEVTELARAASQAPSEAAAKPYLEAAKALRKWRRRCGFYPTVAGTLALAADGLRLDAEELDAHDHLLNVRNGTLDLNTGLLRPHSPHDWLTQIAPIAYEPGAGCPLWLRLVSEAMPDVNTRRELQKWAGYSLSGYIDEHKIGFFYGVGANGKSTILETVQKMLGGGYAKRAVANLLMASNGDRHSAEKAVLMGSRFVLSSETDEGRRFSEQTFKELTDGTLTAQFMRQNPITFPIHFKVSLMANHLPRVKDTTHSFWRRLLVFPFVVKFDKPDLELKEKLLDELPGILSWCVEGYRMWRAEGLHETPAMAALKGKYRKEEDELGRFLEDCCTLGEGLQERSRVLHDAYRNWCGQQGIPEKAMLGTTPFKRGLEARGLEAPRRSSGVVFLGVKLEGWGSS